MKTIEDHIKKSVTPVKVWPKDVKVSQRDIDTETRRGVNNTTDFRLVATAFVGEDIFKIKTRWLGSGAPADKKIFADIVRHKLSLYLRSGRSDGLKDYEDDALTLI
jgi:hypothetical protein